MDDIRVLRDLLSKCDSDLDLSKYDKRINDFYLEEFKSKIKDFNYDKSQFKLKEELHSNEYDLVSEYISKLNKLKNKCNQLVENKIDLSNLNIPNSLYENNVLLLDSISNIDYLLDLLDSFNNISKIYQKIDLNKDFAILSKKIIKNGKKIRIRNKIKYQKMSEEEIINDALKRYDQYYVSKDTISIKVNSMHKKASHSKINTKIVTSIFKVILMDVIPVVLMLLISIYALNHISISYPTFDFTSFDFRPVLVLMVMALISIAIVWIETFISKNIINKIPIVTGVASFWLCLAACLVNYLVFINSFEYTFMDFIIYSLGCLDGFFFGFLAGPNFRHSSETNFSLLGRLLVGLTMMDVIFLFMMPLTNNIAKIVLIVLFTFGAGIAIEYKFMAKSPWYGKGNISKEGKK